MNDTLTAEELLRSFFHYETDETYKELFKFPDKEQILAFGREMARMHVYAALNSASENAELDSINMGSSEFQTVIDKNSILNAYPKELIK